MAKEIVLAAETRAGSGTSAARNLRRKGILPAVLNDESGAAISIQMDRHGFEQMLHHHRSEHLLIDLKIDGGTVKKVLLKDVQHHSVSGDVQHVDFIEISMTEKMEVPIRITLVGDAIGVTRSGGLLEQLLREVEVECLPTDLVESIEVDVSALDIGDILMVGDLVIAPQLTVVTAPDVAVVQVSAPKLEEEPAAAAEAVEGAEGAAPAADGAGADGASSGDKDD